MSIVSELLLVADKLPAVDAKAGVASKLAGASPIALLLVALGAAALAFGGKRLSKLLGERAAAKKALGPETLRPTTQAATPDIPPRQLRRAWLRFLLRLPREYRRSILNFEHFILLGRAGSGKSRLLETHSDYRYQMRQVAGDAPLDPELPVVLASGAIITELPARFLDDETLQGKVAMERLWGPLYARRTPTVVLAVDAAWLTTAAREDIVELARCARSKVNMLSAIRKKPVELRVAFTHLDGLDGALETARFWSQVGISACLPLDAAPSVEESIDAWEREATAQLPRALSAVTADQYRRILAFTRALPKLLGPSTTLVRGLFAVDMMSQTPVRGGVFFCTDAPSSANPLRNAYEAGPGPSPLRRHVQLAAAAVAVSIGYMALAYNVQEEVWAPAADAIMAYQVSPALAGTERERTQRESIDEFTVRHSGILYRFPDFHGRARRAMRAQLSAKLRDGLLVPRLHEVAQFGIPRPDGMTLRWRRSVYFLSLIHSFAADRGQLLSRLPLWEAMTKLPSDLIRDYIWNTDVPYQTPIAFKLAADAHDRRDKPAFWEALPVEVNKALNDGILRPEEISHLRTLIEPMSIAVSRFEHDNETLEIFASIDAVADLGGEHEGNLAPRLHAAYSPQFDEILRGVNEAGLQRQSTQISRLLALVESASVAAPEEKLLHDLSDQLTTLKHGSKDLDAQPIELEFDHGKYAVDVKKWNEALSDGKAAVLVDRFLGATVNQDSIFFSQAIDSELRSVVWNPLATEVSIFGGPARFSARYTKLAFDTHVKKEVERLVDTVDALHVPASYRERLFKQVEHDVSVYASHYHDEAKRFLHSYRVRAQGAEALRVALGEIARDRSSFDDFVLTLGDNTWFGEASIPVPTDAGASDKGAQPKTNAESASTNEAHRLLAPMYDELSAFASWHNVAQDAELKKYKEIAKQLLSDLTPSDAAAGAKPASAKEPALAGALSPVGKVTLGSLREAKGSYLSLVHDWVEGAGLTTDQAEPFLMPFQELSSIGETDIESVISRTWSEDVAPLVRAISAKFPFSRNAEEAASAEEVTAMFHPQDGRLFSLFRDYVEPVVPAEGSGTSAPKVRLPADLQATLSAARVLSARLWDEKGTPRKLELQITPIPFQRSNATTQVATMVYLNVGEQSVFNFNQAPQTARVVVDWTRDEPAQLGLQVTDANTAEQSFPAPVMVEGPYWRLFRLLRKGTTSRVHTPVEGELHEWQLAVDGAHGATIRAGFLVQGDPFQGFNLPHITSGTARLPR